MAETRTSRFGLVQWSSGGDSPARTDFNEAFLNLENRAAYDDGVTSSSLPTAGLYAGRYAMVDDEGRRTLYRRNDAGGWDYAGGNTVPGSLMLRGLPSDSTGATAFSVGHPSLVSPTMSVSWDGSTTVGGTLRSWDGNATSGGTVVIGTTDTASASSLGRLHVRTRSNSDRGLVIRPHGSTVGYLLAVQSTGGADVLSVDGAGRLRQVGTSTLSAASTLGAVSIGGTLDAGDGTSTALYVHGRGGSVSGRDLVRVQRDNDDSNPVMLLGRESASLGRLPWGGSSAGQGVLTLAGRTVTVRGLGYPEGTDETHFQISSASPGSPDNASLDSSLLSISRTRGASHVALDVHNTANSALPPLTLYREGTTSTLLNAIQVVGGSTPTLRNVAIMGGDGRFRTAAPWVTATTTRDSRQSVWHVSRYEWAGLGAPTTAGLNIPRLGFHLHEWPEMVARSYSGASLMVSTIIEVFLTSSAASGAEDAQPITVRTEIRINDGGWTEIGASSNVPLAVGSGSGHRIGGPTYPVRHRYTDFGLSDSDRFTIRTRVEIGGSLVSARLRSLELDVEECVITIYDPQ